MKTLYGSCEQTISRQKQRYSDAVDRFRECYPDCEEISVFSAPGRTEIGGNHTDHQRGRVLAAAVNLDIIAVVSFNNTGVIRLQSEGHSPNNVNLSNLSAQENEKGDSSALIRGIVSRFCEMGIEVRGFDAYTTSDVLSGSGLSSSAASGCCRDGKNWAVCGKRVFRKKERSYGPNCKRILGEKGAVRVHGGGFAGTIQAFVPTDKMNEYVSEMNRIFGNGSCYVLKIRPVGGIEITEGL